MIHIIGDVHGHYTALVKLLHEQTELIDDDLNWVGGQETLCFVGDYVDRGNAGIAVIDLIMKLQSQAADAGVGGEVIALLGNHDVSILGAKRFGGDKRERVKRSFLDDWKRYGGQMSDLEKLTDDHIEWLMNLPAMAQFDDLILVHADSMLYTRYGDSIESVNAEIAGILRSDDLKKWDDLIEDFGEKFAFHKKGLFGKINEKSLENVETFRAMFSGLRIVHGHTPVYRMTNKAATSVTEPYIYNDGRCVNVDACFYSNGPGLVYSPVEEPIVYV